MKLQEVFNLLSNGEFSQLSIGGAQAGVIDGTNYIKVMGHINLGLTALYRRFNLKHSEVSLEMLPDELVYVLDAPDLIKIEKVLDAEGCELPLNDASDEDSVFTPSHLTIKLPESLETQNLKVVYRANHPKLAPVPGGLNANAARDLELPYTHLEPLLYYVASRVHNPIGMSNEFHAGNSYAAKYEMACQELENRGLQVDLGQGNDRLIRNGWV